MLTCYGRDDVVRVIIVCMYVCMYVCMRACMHAGNPSI